MIGIELVETVLYVGLAATIIQIVVIPAIVDIVKQCKEMKIKQKNDEDKSNGKTDIDENC